jgi:hypothetical protein
MSRLQLIGVSQLGGKDAAYVREDADIDYTVAELIDGLHIIHSFVLHVTYALTLPMA